MLVLLAAVLVLGGCGGSGVASSARARALAAACPGAVGPGGVAATHCPYTAIRAIGRRGAGVLRCPEALALAPDGDLYVADQFSHVVQRFSPAGRFLAQWGSYGSGPGQLGAVDGLAVAPGGEVYVLDSTHDRVERFSPAGRLLGEWGSPGAALGQFHFGPGQGPDKPPGGGIAVGRRYVYVADSANNRIVRFDLDGSHPVLIAGPGSAPGQVSSPRGLTVAGGVLYVADEGNHRVQALTLQGRPLYAEGTFGKGPGQFVNPFGVAVHRARVYVVDDNNNRIAVLTRRLQPLEAWSGAGTPYELSYIRAIAASPAGRLYVADTGHERIVVFDGAGRGLRAFGTPGITPGQLIAPLAVAADRAGNVLVAETYGSRSPVYLFDRAAGGGAAGDSPQLRYRTRFERGGGAIIGSHWFGPTAAAFMHDGSVWLTDPANDIVRHLSAGGAFLGAVGAAAGAAGHPGGSGSTGSGTGAGDPSSAAAEAENLLHPEGVAGAPSGNSSSPTPGTVASRASPPPGSRWVSSGPACSSGRSPSRSRPGETSTSPTPATIASSSSVPPVSSSPPGAAPGAPRGASTNPLGSPSTPPGTSSSPTAATGASRSSQRAGVCSPLGGSAGVGSVSSTGPPASPSTAAATCSSPTPRTTACRCLPGPRRRERAARRSRGLDNTATAVYSVLRHGLLTEYRASFDK